MQHAIRVPETMLDSVRSFVQTNGIPLRVVSEGDCSVQVCQAPPDERPESDMSTLYAGGWIACPTALALAARLNIGTRQLGALVNALKIKIKQCSLGCF